MVKRKNVRIGGSYRRAYETGESGEMCVVSGSACALKRKFWGSV
jgi:hypothetical protein